MQDNKDGTYSISYTPKEPGVYTVLVCIKEQHVQVRPESLSPGTPGSVTLGRGDISPGISRRRGLNRILFFFTSLHFRNGRGFGTLILPRGSWWPQSSLALFHLPAITLAVYCSPRWLVGMLNLGKILESRGAIYQQTRVHIQETQI